MRHVVVVGASLAGLHAVEGLRDAGYDGEITLVGAEDRLPYDRPALSKESLRLGPTSTGAPLRPAQWYADHDVILRLGTAARAVDIVRRRLSLSAGSIDFDGLIIATGSSPRMLARVGDPELIHTLRTVDDCTRIHRLLHPGRHLVVIGAGFIGLEVAATARNMGLDVTVVELAPVPLARVLGDEVGRWFAAYHGQRGVTVRCGVGINSMERSGRGSTIHLSDATVLAADVVVAGVGVRPAVDWLHDSGLAVSDGVVCDAHLRCAAAGVVIPGIVAAGDVARWHNVLFDEDMRVEQWTNAVEQGRYAAQSLLGVAGGPYASAPYFWSDQFDAKLRFVGTAHAAQDVHIEHADESSLVALFGRDGVVRAALCVNSPRRLALFRQSIVDKVPWRDIVAA